MPEICRFYGIVIQIYYGDHPPEFTNKSCSMRSSEPQPFSRPGKLHRLSKILAGQ